MNIEIPSAMAVFLFTWFFFTQKGGMCMGIIYGYARCSTDETKQNIDRQVRELCNMGAERQNIFMEYESGSKIDRIELNRLLGLIKEGDTIVATEASRITRSIKQLCEIIDLAKSIKIKIVFGNFVMDCSKELDPMTEGMLKMMGVFSELERNMIRQRVKSGMINARAKGRLIGRPKIRYEDIPAKVRVNFELYKEGHITKTDYAKMCGISRPTLDKYLNLF